MNTSRSSNFHRPFGQLKKLLKVKSTRPILPPDKKPLRQQEIEPETLNEQQLFQEAMADVEPIRSKKRIRRPKKGTPSPISADDADKDILKQLKNLIENGQGFVVADTPEYMEGGSISTHPEILRRLHRGDFSIQAHIDLHGFGVSKAREKLEAFLKDAIRTGKNAVLIIHGRGLSSPGKPVLKTRVYEWLTRGPWRKWVIAFTSAKLHDGGAGATYVLLRQKPLTRRHRKQPPGI